MKKHFILSLLATAALILAIGCSKNPSEPQTLTGEDLSAQFGGYTASNEPVAFGNAQLSAMAAGEVEFSDSLEDNPVVRNWLDNHLLDAYHFRAVWGNLRFDSTETEITDWTGSLEISRGAALLRRVIRFEDNDSILPRTDYQMIEWASHTRPHSDGIAVDLIVPEPHPVIDTTFSYVIDTLTGDTTETIITVDTLPAPPVEVTFTTPKYTRTFTISELRGLDTVIWFEDSTAIHFSAFELERIPCPKGMLSGTWGYDENGDGIFHGTWISRYGRIEGFLEGKFGLNDHGKKVFFGKWIDGTGQFEGLLRGYWAELPDEHASESGFLHAGGMFRGGIFNANGDPIGRLRGRFKADETIESGWFAGRWMIGGCGDGMGHMDNIPDEGEDRPDDFVGGFRQRGDGRN